ncbi:MAG: molybdopterin molybdenumtransferase MoeA, partial [Nitrosomonadales bacterium]|nr:molybdopterin molybdenumtransferase MoeA [Nitrosomonadales bacterium]
MSEKSLSDLINNPSCLDDYDPNSMPVVQARRYIREFLNPVATKESVPLRNTLGRVLAEDIHSPCNVPNHDNSAMDGYAFNADDLAAEGETSLKIIGTAFAGKAFEGQLARGECVRIMTGAVMPQGTDTVVVQERVLVENETIRFTDGPKRGMNMRYAGEDLKQGQVVLAAGHMMRAADLGLIA